MEQSHFVLLVIFWMVLCSVAIQGGNYGCCEQDSECSNGMTCQTLKVCLPPVKKTTAVEKTCLAGTCQSECLPGKICVDLNTTGKIEGKLEGVTIMTSPTALIGGKECSRQATFKVNFELPEGSTCICHEGPYTGRGMLKVEMYFSGNYRNGVMFNIGDNQYYTTPAGNQATVYTNNTEIYVYPNGTPDCEAQLPYNYTGATNTSASQVTVWIANHYIKFANDNGLCEKNCDKCLYELNGNQDIYVAANRFVSDNTTTGYGLCSLKMSWVSGPDK